MKVFISWSGNRSKSLAQALHEWLPLVLQYAEPWVSDKDISAGDRWAQAIAGELESSNFGIICITPENLSSEWVLFEAGALSKSMQDAKVIPLLFGLELSDISGPLAQFQAKKVDQNGLTEVVKAINNVAENKTSDDIVKQLVPALWSKLEDLLSKIPAVDPSDNPTRPQNEILEELVTGVRGLEGRMRQFDLDILEDRPISSRKKNRRFHPMMFEEFMHMTPDGEEDPISLLMIAGLLREDFPWLSEVLIESYRDVKNGGQKEAEKAIQRISRTTKMLRNRPFMEEFYGHSKDVHIMAMELPRMLESVLHRYSKGKFVDFDDD